jgi:hypothetical protein
MTQHAAPASRCFAITHAEFTPIQHSHSAAQLNQPDFIARKLPHYSGHFLAQWRRASQILYVSYH